VRARVVMHLPFPAADVAGLEWHAPQPIAIDGTTGDAHPHDLMLQSYGEDLGDALRSALPHRTASADLPWPGAWVDRWSLEVACLCVAETLEVGDAAWPDYRDRVNVRREAPRARAKQLFGREPLWLCLLHVIEMEAEHGELDAAAAVLTDDGDPCPLDAVPDVAIRLSLDTCVAVRPADLKVAVGVARMIEVHTAIWAAAIEFDRELLPLLTDTDADEPLSELEHHADRLRETSRRVRAFRAPLANTAAHLSELDGPMWQAVADRWALDPQLDALSGRIDALQQMHTDLIAAVSTRHAQRLNRIALALALISGCTAVFAIVQFVIVEPRPTEVRIANALIVLAVAAVAAWLWWTVVVSGRRRR
jgi:hypothetical protein